VQERNIYHFIYHSSYRNVTSSPGQCTTAIVIGERKSFRIPLSPNAAISVDEGPWCQFGTAQGGGAVQMLHSMQKVKPHLLQIGPWQ
jgi:hypothetical protein